MLVPRDAARYPVTAAIMTARWLRTDEEHQLEVFHVAGIP